MSKLFEEAFNLLCGSRIGAGSAREVYECTLLPDCVVKVETLAESFQNIIEWETWKIVQNTPQSRWFARCDYISPCGLLLLMERTRPPALSEYPRQMPAYFADFKRRNYGMAKTRQKRVEVFVCHDYGLNLLVDHGLQVSKKKVVWNDNA